VERRAITLVSGEEGKLYTAKKQPHSTTLIVDSLHPSNASHTPCQP
jgi:hypothetical protein